MKANPVFYIVAGLLAWAAAGAQADEKAVLLGRNYREGQTARYRSVIQVQIRPKETAQTYTAAQTSIDRFEVKEVRKNGDVAMVLRTEKSSYTINGVEREVPPEPPVTTVRDRRNRLLKYDQPETLTVFLSPEVRQVIVTLAEIVFPDGPVATGTTWQTEMDNPMAREKKIGLKTTYLGKVKLDGVELWKVTQVATADTGANGAPLTAEVTAWLDPANGQTVREEYTLKSIPSQFGRMDSTAKMSLIPLEPEHKSPLARHSWHGTQYAGRGSRPQTVSLATDGTTR